MVEQAVELLGDFNHVDVIGLGIQRVRNPLNAENAVDRRRAIAPRERHVGHRVHLAVFHGVDGRPVGIGTNKLIGTAAHNVVPCNDDLRVPCKNLLERNGAHALALLGFDILSHIVGASAIERQGMCGTLGLGLQALGALSVIQANALILGDGRDGSIDIVKRGLAIGRQLLGLVLFAQQRAKRAIRGGRRIEGAIQNDDGNARLALQVVSGA